MRAAWFALPVVGLATSPCLTAHTQQGATQEKLNRAHESREWLLPNHDYGGVRFVDLKQITPGNVASLRPVCLFQGADLTRSQTNSLVYRGVMYLTTTWSTVALDPTNCKVKWRHDWMAKAKEGNTSR